MAISSGFPFESKTIDILGSSMHYIEEGKGDPILFLHGNPTSGYLWRNIIPHVSNLGRCLAPDLIGMGQSDKPEIAYRFFDHYKYIKAFIDKLELDNITMVLHDWGSGLGFHYAMNHEEKIKGLAFMEAIVKPMSWSDFGAQFKMGFKLLRTPGIGWFMIHVMNIFVNQILPQATIRQLTEQEKQRYRAPFKTIKSRKPIRQWPLEIPIDGKPADIHQIVETYSRKLQQSKIPKLLLYATPGGIINRENLEWCKTNLTNLNTVHVGKGIHYLQEDHPNIIGKELAQWYKGINAE